MNFNEIYDLADELSESISANVDKVYYTSIICHEKDNNVDLIISQEVPDYHAEKQIMVYKKCVNIFVRGDDNFTKSIKNYIENL